MWTPTWLSSARMGGGLFFITQCTHGVNCGESHKGGQSSTFQRTLDCTELISFVPYTALLKTQSVKIESLVWRSPASKCPAMRVWP